MRRRPMNRRKYAKKFTRTHNRTKAINSPAFIMRGGIRL